MKWKAAWMSQTGSTYEARIMVEGYEGQPIEVDLDSDPGQIEWSEVDKLGTVQGSGLTLNLISDTDREFESLYTVRPGDISVDLYRNDSLYWVGSLDPELWEEPYAYQRGYVTSATFTDFNVLERIPYEATGMQSVEQIVSMCLRAAGLGSLARQTSIALRTADNNPVNLSAVYVDSDNFYDEQGEAFTLREVLEGVLKPFGFHLIQKAGKTILYDLGWLYASAPSRLIYWTSTDQRIQSEKTYNNVKLTFSPYASTTIADGSVETSAVAKGVTESEDFFYTFLAYNSPPVFSVYEHEGESPTSKVEVKNGAKWVRFAAGLSGSDTAAIAWFYCTANTRENWYGHKLNSQAKAMENGECISFEIARIPGDLVTYDADTSSTYRLKVSLEVLMDTRYNPFESGDIDNSAVVSDDYDKQKNWANFAYIPVKILLRNSEGLVTHHYHNRGVMESNGYASTGSMSGWSLGEGSWGDCWLAYYDPQNRKSASGLDGWSSNRPMIGYYRGKLPEQIAKQTGDTIPMPPAAGWIEMQIGSGLYQFDQGREEKNLYPRLRWQMYRNPKIELVGRYGETLRPEDEEHKAWINEDAREPLTIDTIVGQSRTKPLPTARGIIYRQNLTPFGQFSIGGVVDSLEGLLIGQAYSQYAERGSVLTGTASMLPTLCAVTDAATSGKFAVTSEVQNLGTGESEISASEIKAFNYQANE